MNRRALLQALGTAGAAGLLGSCSRAREAPGSIGQPSPEGSLDRLVARIAPEAEQDLSVVTGSYEQLVGNDRPLAFGLTDSANEPLAGLDVEVYISALDGPTPQPLPPGPAAAEFREIPGNPLGLYVARVNLERPGNTAVVVVTRDGARAGLAAVPVRTIEQSGFPAPTELAPAIATPTVADPLGLVELCTRRPPCPMHEVSLDTALAEGRPVMLEFATPAYCQTSVCGPAVDVLDQVRAARDWGEVAWIHVEIYRDEGRTLAPPVEQWSLPSEPWLYAIAGDSVIAARADGPLLNLPDEVARFAALLGQRTREERGVQNLRRPATDRNTEPTPVPALAVRR